MCKTFLGAGTVHDWGVKPAFVEWCAQTVEQSVPVNADADRLCGCCYSGIFPLCGKQTAKADRCSSQFPLLICESEMEAN